MDLKIKIRVIHAPWGDDKREFTDCDTLIPDNPHSGLVPYEGEFTIGFIPNDIIKMIYLVTELPK